MTKAQKEAVLLQLPFQIFLFVAHADGVVDVEETQSFSQVLLDMNKTRSRSQFIRFDKKPNSVSPYSKRLFRKTLAEYSLLVRQLRQGQIKKDIRVIQKSVEIINEVLPPQKAFQLKRDLFTLAEHIARSSRASGKKGFTLLNSEISKDEAKALVELETILNNQTTTSDLDREEEFNHSLQLSEDILRDLQRRKIHEALIKLSLFLAIIVTGCFAVYYKEILAFLEPLEVLRAPRREP